MTSASDPVKPRRSDESSPSTFPFLAEHLDALFAAVAEAIYLEDIDSGRIIYWSPGAAALFGYSRAEISGQSASRLLGNGDEEQNRPHQAPGMTSGEVEKDGRWRIRRRFRRADGSAFEAETFTSLLSPDRGRCAVVYVRPLTPADAIGKEAIATALAQTTARPESSEQAIGRLLRNLANYAVFSTDASARIAEWNQEASRIFGYERAEVDAQHLSLICVEDSARALQKIFAQATERGSARYYQWMTRKNGKRFYARVVVFALCDDQRVQGFLFVLRDDSREPNLRQILREKEQMAAIGAAASILAHEIGNPLNGISATVQLLEHCLSRPTLPAAESMLSSVRDLRSEVKRLTELLTEFKNIAWPQKLALAPVNLQRLIEELARDSEMRRYKQRVELSLESQSDLPLLNGDDEKLREALRNLIDNALDAMPHGGRLEIKTYQHEQSICIDIIDTGAGIPKNLKVFDLFSSTKPEGIGLGLFLVQQIVLAHDGAITYSSAPDKGTTFHVTFALNPPPDPLGVDFLDLV